MKNKDNAIFTTKGRTMILKNLFTISALLSCTLVNSMKAMEKAEHTKRVYAVSSSNTSMRNFFPNLVQTFKWDRKIRAQFMKKEAAQALLVLAQQRVKNNEKI
jgi:hypothetical protein